MKGVGRCLIWRSLFEEGCCCQVLTQWWVVFWWTSDLESKNLGLMRRKFVAFFGYGIDSFVALYPFMAGDPNKNCCLVSLHGWGSK